jgi:hypothetical protein
MRKAAGSLLLLLLFSSVSFAQPFGFEIGAGQSIQTGHFIAPCGCTFAHGKGLSLSGGILYDIFSSGDFTFGARVSVDYMHVTDHEVVPETLVEIADGDKEETSLTYLVYSPYVRYVIPKTEIFLQVAPEAGFLISKKFEHVTGSSAEEEEPGANNPIDITSIRISARFSAGYNFHFDAFTLAPTFSYDLGISTLREEPTDVNWKISTFTGSVTVRVNI